VALDEGVLEDQRSLSLVATTVSIVANSARSASVFGASARR